MTHLCPVCSSPHTQELRGGLEGQYSAENLKITDASYGDVLPLLQCKSCTFIFADPDLANALTQHYVDLDDPVYIETEDSRRLQMRRTLEFAKAMLPKAKSLLDIGAGGGLLIDEAKALGWERCIGIEPSEKLAKYAQGKERKVYQGHWPHPELEKEDFDLIVLLDVIEHLTQPTRMLQALRDWLAPGGALLLVTPDLSSLPARLLGPRWWHYRLAHIGYFNNKTIEIAAQKAGYRVQTVRWATWYFPVWYLAERVERFLPLHWLNHIAPKVPILRSIYQSTIPLNLFDSKLYLLEAQSDQ